MTIHTQHDTTQEADIMTAPTTPPTPFVERVIVGVDGSEGSITALRQAVDEARCHGAELWPVISWSPPGGEAADAMYPAPDYMCKAWVNDARERLDAACREAMRNTPDYEAMHPKVYRGNAGDVLIACACRPTDILVLGSSNHSAMHHILFGSVSQHCLKYASCPVLVVHPESPELHSPAGATRLAARNNAPRRVRQVRPIRPPYSDAHS